MMMPVMSQIMKQGRIVVNAAYVTERLRDIAEDEDLSKFIL